MYGASPISEALLNRAMAALPGAAFHQAYGMTELSPVATHLTLGPAHREDAEEEPAARRRPRRDRLRGADRRRRGQAEVPRGTVGEVAVRGQNVMMGYWNGRRKPRRPCATAGCTPATAATWTRKASSIMVDRVKDMIVSRRRERLFDRSRERARPAPAVSHMRGDRHSRANNGARRVHAVVMLRSAGAHAMPHEIIAFCQEQIADYKCPRSVDVRPSRCRCRAPARC